MSGWTEKRRALRNWRSRLVSDAKQGMGCCVCGFRQCSSALHFHHFEPGEKREKVTNIIRHYGVKSLIQELRNCIVLCANCHAIEEMRFESVQRNAARCGAMSAERRVRGEGADGGGVRA